MSWWVSLSNNDGMVEVPLFSDGGARVVDGDSHADLNITYNYSVRYGEIDWEGLRSLDGMKASDAIPLLEGVVTKLGTVQHDDYWKPTKGNAGHALSILLGWAHLHPGAVFRVR